MNDRGSLHSSKDRNNDIVLREQNQYSKTFNRKFSSINDENNHKNTRKAPKDFLDNKNPEEYSMVKQRILHKNPRLNHLDQMSIKNRTYSCNTRIEPLDTE